MNTKMFSKITLCCTLFCGFPAMSMVYADTGNVPAQSPLQQTVKVSGTVTDSEGAVNRGECC